jgi:sugar phosphate isomerase/epimerase
MEPAVGLAPSGAQMAVRAADDEPAAAVPRFEHLNGRLGLNVPTGWWPTGLTVKAAEAAGFDWVQVHAPPPSMLGDAGRRTEHAAALRAALDHGAQHLVLHAPDDLSVGSDAADRAFAGLMRYARDVRSEIVVYHGGNFAVDNLGAWNRVEDRASMEERSLRRFLPELESLGITLAIENLAPVYPGPVRLCHAPSWVGGLIARLESPNVGMCFDLGHAHIVAGLTGADVRALLEPVSERVVLFHLHDNLGARPRPDRAAGLDPLRLDLHLAPGMGTLPWERVAAQLGGHRAPLQLEVHPPHRPDPINLATITTGLLTAPA